jgi:hypothetical protein
MDTRLLQLILPVCWLVMSACTQTTPFITMTLATPDLTTNVSDPAHPRMNTPLEVDGIIQAISLNDSNLDRNHCLFTVDYPHSPNTLLQANGDPGQPSFNVTLSSPHIQAVQDGTFPCDPNVVPNPQALTFQPNPLSVGIRQTAGAFTIETGKGTFGVSGNQPVGRMEFTLTSFDRNRDRAVGDVRFLFRRICSDPSDTACPMDTTVLYGVGSFLMPIH